VDLSIPTELIQLQESVRRFVTRELRPLEHDIDQADDIDPDLARELRMRAVALGLVGFNIPAGIGGGGVGPLGEVLIGEEVGRTSVPLADAVGRLPQALVFASEEQRPWLLAPALRGETTVCVALSEPDAGSDLMGIQTQARPDGDSWKINGSKVFISNVDTCDYALVLAVTDPTAPLRSRFTTFVVDRNDPGLEITRRFRKMGWRGYHISAFSLDTHVACDRVLGEVGGGFETIMASVNSMRLYIASRCVGAAKELLRLAVEYTQNRSTFGQRLGDHQAIQFMLADMDVEIEAARLLVLSTAWKAENKADDVRIAASRAKLYASEMAGRAADATVQIFGGAGYMDDYPVERLYRDVRAFRIGEGTSEMQRVQIARHLLNGA